MAENKLIVDGAVAAGALTLPWWAINLSGWMYFVTVLGGLILVCFRIMLAVREWKQPSKSE
jgi:hypothetical protein